MREYVLSIVIAGIICAVTRCLLDENSSTGKISQILTGIFMCVTIVAPLSNFSFSDIAYYFDGLTVDSAVYIDDGKTATQNSVSEIIKSQAEAYILDKAKSMGLDISVEVELDDNNHSIPCGITIDGSVSPYIKEVMGDYIEQTLGITRENQRWI